MMKPLVFCALLLAVPVSAPVYAALDCSRARSNSEKLICSNRNLLRAEEIMALAFRGAIYRGNDPKVLMQTQRRWIDEVRDLCNDAACMLKAYEDRAAELDNL